MMDLKNGVLKLEADLDANKAIPLIRLALFNLEEGGIIDEAGVIDARPADGGSVEVYVTNMKELAKYYNIDTEAKVQKMFYRLLKRLGNEIERDIKGFIANLKENGSSDEEAITELEYILENGDDDFPGYSQSTYCYGDEKQIIAELKRLAKSASVAVINQVKQAPVQSESIAYADLPWAEKQQNTVNEQKMQKLFPSKRLDEAMERLFEDAPEKREPAKFEEDYLKG